MHPILALVGPSGSGKTTILDELHRRHPNKTLFIRTLTSRPFRGPEDEKCYIPASKEEIIEMQGRGEIFQILPYAGNLYATRRTDLKMWLSQGVGLMALVDDAVDLYRSEFELVVVKIRPTGQWANRDSIRAAADLKRDEIDIRPDLVIENFFDPSHPDVGLMAVVDRIEQHLVALHVL